LIFKTVNPRGMQSITSQTIDTNQIPLGILKVIGPLLIELENFNESLDELEFVESCIALLKSKTVAERSFILEFGKQNKLKEVRHSFTPYISDKSKELAVHKLKKVSQVDLS
jgi:hypothetical protein